MIISEGRTCSFWYDGSRPGFCPQTLQDYTQHSTLCTYRSLLRITLYISLCRSKVKFASKFLARYGYDSEISHTLVLGTYTYRKQNSPLGSWQLCEWPVHWPVGIFPETRKLCVCHKRHLMDARSLPFTHATHTYRIHCPRTVHSQALYGARYHKFSCWLPNKMSLKLVRVFTS
jgi:hypothetical protein